jgi:hypothetical protein
VQPVLRSSKDIFVRVTGFFTNRKAVEKYFVATAQEFLADNVTHLEFRPLTAPLHLAATRVL